MFAFLTSRLGISVVIMAIIAILAGAAYVQHQVISNLRTKIDLLGVQATALQHANETMTRDIAAVQRLAQMTNRSLETIRVQATQTAQAIHQRRFVGDPHKLQEQANQESTETFARLRSLSAN